MIINAIKNGEEVHVLGGTIVQQLPDSKNTRLITWPIVELPDKGAATFDSSYFNDNGSGLIQFGVNYGTGTVSASAVTVNQPRGKITYNSPSILAAGVASFTFTNSYINATSTINIGINGNGANLTSVNCYIKSQTAGSCVVNVQNLSLLSLFNTNMIVDFLVVN